MGNLEKHLNIRPCWHFSFCGLYCGVNYPNNGAAWLYLLHWNLQAICMQSPLIGLRLINCKAVVQKYIKAGNKEPVKENPHGMLQSWSSATPPWWQGQASACSFCPLKVLSVFCTPDLLHSPCPRASGTVTPCSGLGTALLLAAQSLHQPRKKVVFLFFQPKSWSRTCRVFLVIPQNSEYLPHQSYGNSPTQMFWKWKPSD